MEKELDQVLYVDDEVENLRGFQFIFKKFYKIHLAQSAEEGLKVLKNNPIKLILADQRMPKMTGVDFFEIAADLYPNIIRIILTGFSDIEAIIKAINKGKIFKYVTKPWDKEELKLIIDNALWSYNISSENRSLIQSLKEANQNLEQKVKERTEEIFKQKAEIESQRDFANAQRDQIAKQNAELEIHRNQLEELVQERTIDLIKAKEKAEESDKLKSAFLANFSHEIRTPMNAIMGFSQLLANNEVAENEKIEFLGLILINSQHLLNLINEIIDISRIEAGELILKIEPCSINHLFKALHAQYEEQKVIMKKSNLEITFSPDINHTNLTLATDINKFRQIIINLLENAFKFTDEGSIDFGFTVKKLDGQDMVVFYVKDTGIGIDLESTNFIFERFRKVEDKSANKLYRGAGLGLSISKRLVGFLGGSIWVESKPNKGSTFYFTLPYNTQINDNNKNKEDLVEKINIYDWNDRLILVAEDEPSNFKFIEKILAKTNIKLIWAKNGQETIDLLEQHKNIDLILMDILMPVINGFEATKKIKDMNNQIPIIAQTAYAFENEKEEILKAGCDDYITKPFTDIQLISIINKYLS